MSARAKVLAIAKRLGCKVYSEVENRDFVLRIEAPQGHRFAQDEIHEMVCTSPWPWRTPAWEEALERLKDESIEKCPDRGCEWCEDTAREGGAS